MSGQMYVYIKIYGTDFTSYRRYLMQKQKSNAAVLHYLGLCTVECQLSDCAHYSLVLILLPQRENRLKF